MPFLLLFLEALLFSRHLLIDSNNVIPWDFRFWHLPHAIFISRALHAHEFPLWNPYIYCGMPFAANVQTALFYPLRMAAVLTGTLLGESKMLYCLEAEWIASMFLGGVFAYLLARNLKMDKASALLAASVYELGAFFASQAEHLGAIEIAAWLPLVWLATLKLPSRLWACVLSAALAMSILGGFTPLTLVVFLSSLLLVSGSLLPRSLPPRYLPSREREGAALNRRIWIAWSASIAAALLLTAMIVVPAAQLRGLSVSRFRTDWVGTGGGLPLAGLRTLFYANAKPVPGDITFQYLYCGLIAIGFAVTKLRTRWGLMALTAALLMLGDSTPIGAFLHGLLPSFVQDAYYPQQWLAPFTLAIAICAGLGLQPLLARHRLAIIAVPLAIAELICFNSARPFNLTTLTAEPGVTADAFNGNKELLCAVEADTSTNRLDTMNDSIHWVASAMITGIPTAGGQDPMALSRYMQVRGIFCRGKRYGVYYQVEDLKSSLLNALNIGAVVTRSKPPEPFHEVPGGYIYRNLNVLPRFYLADKVTRTDSLEASIASLRSDPSTVTVEGPVSGTGSAGTVALTNYLRNSIDLTVNARQPAFLASSEPNYPGWKATIDGHPAAIYNTNAAFRGLSVPAGRHRIRFVFAPAILFVSFGVSVAAWLAWIILTVRYSLRERIARFQFASIDPVLVTSDFHAACRPGQE
jgi:Bacterial membrane protein YfhO